MASEQPLNVLFVCTHNSARSIMAECILNQLGLGRFRGYSAGSQPSGSVHPYALDLLRELNHDTSGLHSKSWEQFSEPGAPPIDFVFTVCDRAAGEVCPVWQGQPMSAHWSVPDPSAVQGHESEQRFALATTYRLLFERIGLFLNLALLGADKLSLQRRLDDIGRMDVRAREKA
jgi:protein-tyrosine-phosphatase